MATLRVYRGDQFVAPFELGEGRTRIGRGTDNHLVLEDHDKQVSRVHAEIWHERGRYVIADLNSQNGVWIGERQIKTEEPLPENVWVTIGPYRLMLMPDEKAPYTLDDLDGAEMTRESGAFVEPTQLADPMTAPPASNAELQGNVVEDSAERQCPATGGDVANVAGTKSKGGYTMPIARRSGGCPRPRRGRGHDDAEIRHRHRDRDRRLHADTAADHHLNPGSHRADSRGGVPGSLREGAGLHSAGQQGLRAEENTAALAALPDDPRGVAQRTAIDAMPEAGAATPPPDLARWNSPSWNGPAKPAAPLPETLRVSARPGEPEERARHSREERTEPARGRQEGAGRSAVRCGNQRASVGDNRERPGRLRRPAE